MGIHFDTSTPHLRIYPKGRILKDGYNKLGHCNMNITVKTGSHRDEVKPLKVIMPQICIFDLKRCLYAHILLVKKETMA